jgi:hypothetical protein
MKSDDCPRQTLKSPMIFRSRGTALASCAIANLASAQPASPQPPAGPIAAPPPPPGAPAFNAQQMPEARGTVQRFTLTPRGELDGFLLTDGTEVHLPPHLSDQLATAVRLGDPVSVRGYRSPAAPLIVATAVTDIATNQTVVDQGPPPPGTRPPPLPPGVPSPGAQQTSLNGRVQASLYGPAGDLNGAVLYDGTIIRMPPQEAYQFAGLLTPGQMVTVQGWTLNTSYGRVVDAQGVAPASAQVAAPPIAPFAPPPPPPARP